jgi:hypothetical protein
MAFSPLIPEIAFPLLCEASERRFQWFIDEYLSDFMRAALVMPGRWCHR